jgi:hypothetical protein
VAQRKNAAVTPDKIHRQSDKTEAKRLAQSFYEACGNYPNSETLGQDGHSDSEQAKTDQKDKDRGIAQDERGPFGPSV